METENTLQDISLKDLLDIPTFQDLTDSFAQMTGISNGIVDLQGEVLTSSGWQKICTEFHRKNPTTASRCLESDTILANQSAKGGKPHFYKCKNGLAEVVFPIIIENTHVANLIIGQFLFYPPDINSFTQQAEEFGFNKELYLVALSKVPVFSADKINQVVNFLADLTILIRSSGEDKKKLFELNINVDQRIQEQTAHLQREIEIRKEIEVEYEREMTELKLVENQMRIERTFSESLINSLPGIMYVVDDLGRLKRWNKNLEIAGGYPVDQLMEMRVFDFIAPEDKTSVIQAFEKVFLEGTASVEAKICINGGQLIPYFLTGQKFILDKYKYVVGVGLDISDRIKFEKEKEILINSLQDALFKVKQLSGFLPICASCKRIRDDEGYWNQLEEYIRDRSEAEFTHCICPDCARKLYPDIDLTHDE